MSNKFECSCCGNVYDIGSYRRIVAKLKKAEADQFKIGHGVIQKVASKWLDIIWKGKMVQINGKGKIRVKRQKKNS